MAQAPLPPPRRIAGLAAVAVLAALLLAACNGDSDGGGEVRGTPGGPVTVTLWHSMPSLTQGVLVALVDEFNQSQSQYRVEPIFQGGYSESFTKLRSSAGSGNVPALIQLSDNFTQIMIDSGVVTPVQDFVDDEDYDLADFEPKAMAYYTVDDTLYAMPFNLAGPLLYYDREVFEAAGLDSDDPPATLEEVRQYSERIVQSGAAQYGISLEVSPWVFEQMLAMGGELYVDNDNGRSGRATEALFAGEQGIEIIEWWDGMVEDGLAYNAGDDELDQMLKLASGEAAMAVQSTAALRGAIAAATIVGRDPARYDAAPMPGPEGEQGGIVLGGAALWIIDERPAEEQRGAWEFIKYLSQPEQQARWHADTGYFPGRVSAYDLEPAVSAREEYPQFLTAVEQLHAAPDTPATRGALLGPFQAVRDRVRQAFERALAGGADPAVELQSAAEEANRLIEDYNRTAD